MNALGAQALEMPGAAAPVEQPKPAAPPVAQPFGMRIIIGLVGVLLAVLLAGVNEMVTKMAMSDIRGAMHIGSDEGTWLIALYSATSVSAMAFAPWCAVTFTLRRFTLCAIGAFAVLGVLCPLAPNLTCLMVLRTLQGAASGALPPMLMSVALRFLPPNIKLYGLAGYALTATFGPSIGLPLAGLWTEYAPWQVIFWQIIPPALVAMACVAYGLPQDPMRLERLKQFDYRGLMLGLPAICSLVIGISLGDRMDWFESTLICWLLGGGAVLMVLFMINEWSHPLPFFKLQMLSNRNLTHSLITLGGVLVVLSGVIIIPYSFLAHIQGYRPAQTAPVLLVVALPQLLALPLVAALCNIRRVDCRWVLAVGLGLLCAACMAGSLMTSQWIRDNFYLMQCLQIFGQPMAVIPLLMLATNGMTPPEGPLASSWFNTVKGLASVVASGLIEWLTTTRQHFHSTMLVDSLGNSPLADLNDPTLAGRLHAQAQVLTSADLYLYMGMVAALLIVLIPFVPTRIYPPRAVA